MEETKKAKRLKKARIFEISLILFLITVMIVLYFIGRAKNLEQPGFSTSAELELKGKIFVSRFEDGKLRLTLIGQDLQYHQAQGEARLLNPEIEIYDEKNATLISGKKARYFNQEGKVRFEDGVEITYQDYRAQTESLNYDLKQELAEGAEEIRIQGKDLDLTGKGFRFDAKKKEMQLNSQVKGKIKRQEKG